MDTFTPIVNILIGQDQEEADSYDSPSVGAAAGDKGEATNQESPNDARSTGGLGGVEAPCVLL